VQVDTHRNEAFWGLGIINSLRSNGLAGMMSVTAMLRQLRKGACRRVAV
jgi:hypothetical protein